MEDETEIVDISKTIFNTFLLHLRKKLRTAVNFTERALKNKCKALKGGKVGKADPQEKNNAKIKNYEDQVAALKNFTLLDIGKFVVMVQKPLDTVLSDPTASVEQKALTRIAYNKHVVKDVEDFRKKYPEWEEKIPNFIKSLGINYRKLRMIRLKKNNRKDKVFESERKLLFLMNEVVGLGVDVKLLEEMSSEKVLPLKRTTKMKNDSKEKLKAENGIKSKPLERGSIKVKKKVEKREAEGEEEEEVEEEAKDVKSLLKIEKIKSPVKITSIFENITDSDEDEEDEEKEHVEEMEEEDEEKEEEDEEMEEEDEEKEEVVLKTKQFKKSENKSQIITKPGKTNKTTTQTENSKIVNNNKNNSNENNNNKRKVKSSTKESTSSPPKKSKLLQTPSFIDKKNKEFAEDSSKEPVTLSRENEIIKKQNKGTSKVTILKLSKVDNKNKGHMEEEENELLKSGEREGALSESEDESFLKNGKLIEKKKKKTSSFFVGRMERAASESGSDLDDSSPEDETEVRSGLKPMFNNRLKRKAEKDEDPSNYDSSKFFKSKLFRGDDSGSGTRGERFAGRSGSGGGRGGSERSFRGGRGGSERSFRGGRGRGGFRDADSKFGDRRGDFENRDRQGFRGRGRGRGHFGNKDKRESFSNEREGRRFSDNGRGRGRGSRGGSAGRGRNRQTDDFSQSSNFAPLGNKKTFANNKEPQSLLHPSWAAKKKQMEQVSKTTFQGKKTVFDD